MQPFRVELTLATNRISSDPIHFDGFLAAIAVQLAGGDITAGDHLPLERTEGVWKASYLMMPTIWRSRMSFIRKADFWQTALDKDDSYTTRSNQFNLGSGHFKAYIFTRSTCQSPKAIAYGIGDIEQVRALLASARSVGPLQRLSAGLISNIEIFEDDDALEFWQIRNMPYQKDGYEPMVGGLAAPYWKRQLHQVVWVPTRSIIRGAESRFAKSTT